MIRAILILGSSGIERSCSSGGSAAATGRRNVQAFRQRLIPKTWPCLSLRYKRIPTVAMDPRAVEQSDLCRREKTSGINERDADGKMDREQEKQS